MPLQSIDLFSGIGGMTLAMEKIATPLLYCEYDPTRQRVLNALMHKGLLPTAPLHPDVRTLQPRDVPNSIPDIVVGSWPCFPAGTLITTHRGYVPIEALDGSERVLTHTGAYRSIVNLQRKPFPFGRLVHIEARGHFRPLQCTEEHPFYVLPKASTNPVWMQAKHLTSAYMVGLPVDTRSIFPDTQPVSMTSEDHFWAAGYFLGDGWRVESGRRVYFVINQRQKDVVLQRLEKVIPGLRHAESCPGCDKFVTTDARWWTMLKDFGKYSHGKVVPDWVHASPKHLVKAFVEGYMTADGCIRAAPGAKEEWRMTTVSLNIALSMQRLCAKLGMAFGVSETLLPPKTTICNRVVNQRTRYTVQGTVGSKHHVSHGCVWFPITYVTRVTTSDPMTVYNLEVENDQSYCVDNTAVHNCKGFSACGRMNAFEHPESALFSEYARLVHDIKPKFFLQENVPGVTGHELEQIIQQFSEAYDVAWTVLPAYVVGAPHIRKRWFCFGVRKDVREYVLSDIASACSDWSVEPCPRMTLDKTYSQRISMLGNSVVPQCARLAFLLLFTGFSVPLEQLRHATEVHLRRPDTRSLSPLESMAPGSNAMLHRHHGCAVDGVMYAVPMTFPPIPRLNLRLLPGAYKGSSRRVSSENVVNDPVDLRIWCTPRGSALTPGYVLTRRGQRDLATQIRFEANTSNDLRGGRINPEFIEWMMGFPLGWTQA